MGNCICGHECRVATCSACLSKRPCTTVGVNRYGEMLNINLCQECAERAYSRARAAQMLADREEGP